MRVFSSALPVSSTSLMALAHVHVDENIGPVRSAS